MIDGRETAGLQTQYNGNWPIVWRRRRSRSSRLIALFLVFQRSVVRSITITGFR